MISGQRWRSQDSVPSKSKTTWLICGRGTTGWQISICPRSVTAENICWPVKAVCLKRSTLRLTVATAASASLMNQDSTPVNRRHFLKVAATAGAAAALGNLAFSAEKPHAGKLRLGFDNFSVRAMNWKAPALLDYAASLNLDSV